MKQSETESRHIRVYISSTFRDMEAEREELIKRIFPLLRKQCMQRNIVLTEVDLRWGITAQQEEKGDVLPVCLAEIDGCRPYFICFLGDRYGSVPRHIEAEHGDRSITELEIRHGVLDTEIAMEGAFFYFREPVPGRSGDNEGQGREKLNALKEEIRQSGLPLKENYRDARALGRMVLHDLTEIIDKKFPQASTPQGPDLETAGHELFARRHCLFHIHRQDYYKRLDRHVAEVGEPLLVTGETGTGKSALIANWLRRYREKNPQHMVTAHFIGATSQGNHWAALVQRLIYQLNHHMQRPTPAPVEMGQLQHAFSETLKEAARTLTAPVTIIVDGLDQLAADDNGRDLFWLPQHIPPRIRLIICCAPGAVYNRLMLREDQGQVLEIEALRETERRQFISGYLGRYSKSLDRQQTERLMRHQGAANPLFLGVLLEELRIYGDYDTLENKLNLYLDTATIEELYQKILARYEADFQRERDGLVCDSMSYIWASRHGLTEHELLELLGDKEKPLAQAWWSPLYIGAEQFLMKDDGFIRFRHDNFRRAVESRYLKTGRQRKAVHTGLADYFHSQRLEKRGMDEVPWQLVQAESWQGLCDYLVDGALLVSLWKQKPMAVQTYWARLEAESQFRAVEAFGQVLQQPEQFRELVWPLSQLLYQLGCIQQAQQLWQWQVKRLQGEEDQLNLAGAMQNRSLGFLATGNYANAMQDMEDAEKIWRLVGFKPGLQQTLNNKAALLRLMGEFAEALTVMDEAESISRESDDTAALQRILENRGLTLRYMGRFDHAMALHKESEQMARRLDQAENIASSQLNQATILRLRGNLPGALELSEHTLQFSRMSGNKKALEAVLGNQAIFLINLERYDEALERAREQEIISRQMGYKEGIIRSLGNRAQIHFLQNDLPAAKEAYEMCLNIIRQMQTANPVMLQSVLGNLGLIYKEEGNFQKALTLFTEDETICREIGHWLGLRDCLHNKACLLEQLDRGQEALLLYQEEETICRKLETHFQLARCLVSQSRLLAVQLTRPQEAVSPIKEGLQLATTHNLESLMEDIKKTWFWVHTALTM